MIIMETYSKANEIQATSNGIGIKQGRERVGITVKIEKLSIIQN